LGRGGSLILWLFVVFGMGGCPRVPVEPSGAQEPPGERPVLPGLVRSFELLDPSHHDYFLQPPSSGLLLTDLEPVFDTKTVQRIRTFWGAQRVIQFTDVTRADPSLSPAMAWVFGPNRATGAETIEAVLLRDFTGAPRAPTWEELLLSLAPRWPLAWDVCAPTRSGDPGGGPTLVAHNRATGAKIGLSEEDGVWVIDHVAFLSMGLDLSSWWAEKGYGGCSRLGSMASDGEFQPTEE